jgi:hypothetical protein
VRGAIFDSAMRPVVIVFLDPAGNAGPCFFQVPVLRRPHFFFLQAAMEPFDVAVALRVITDNGTQFTSARFLETLGRLGITHRRTAYHKFDRPDCLWAACGSTSSIG